jgi:hypothetical protein
MSETLPYVTILSFKVRIDLFAIMAVEERLGKTLPEILNRPLGITTAVAFITAGAGSYARLVKNPALDVAEPEVVNALTDYFKTGGTTQALLAKIIEAINECFPGGDQKKTDQPQESPGA